jgi:predicted MFS family arabinose efflux permease
LPEPKVAARSTSVAAAIYLGVTAAAFASVLPMIVGVLAGPMGLGAGRAGYIAAADMAGGIAGTFLSLWAMRRIRWPVAMRLFLVLLIGTNVATVWVSAYAPLLVVRTLAGVSEGAVLTICYAVLGVAASPERALAFYCAGQMLLGAVGSLAIPWMVASGGRSAPFWALAAFAVPGLLCAGALPAPLKTPAPRDERRAHPTPGRTWLVWAGLASIFLYFSGAGAVYAYLERLGIAAELSPLTVASALSAASIAGLCGSLMVGVLARQLDQRLGSGGSALLTLAAMLALMADSHSVTVFTAATCAFLFAWNIFYPMTFGALAAVDQAGAATASTHAVTGSGLALGPALAAFLLPWLGIHQIPLVGMAAVVLGLALLVPIALARHPALPVTLSPADAKS